LHTQETQSKRGGGKFMGKREFTERMRQLILGKDCSREKEGWLKEVKGRLSLNWIGETFTSW